jgi:hypothetical protein
VLKELAFQKRPDWRWGNHGVRWLGRTVRESDHRLHAEFGHIRVRQNVKLEDKVRADKIKGFGVNCHAIKHHDIGADIVDHM